MFPFRHNWIVAVGAFLSAATLVAEAGFLIAARRAAREANARLARLDRERSALGARDPAPTAERAAAIEAELAQATETLRALENRLRRCAGPEAPAPASSTDAFFELTGFARSLNERAAHAGIAVRDGGRFGFSAYAHDGPAPALIPAVDRQQRFAAALLQTLISAQPFGIEGVQREDPEAGRATAGRGGGGRAPATDDFFSIDPRLSLRVAGAVDTTAFRLVFTGHSRALRCLLNQLTALDNPAAVRSVAVEPAGEPPSRRPVPGSAGGPLPAVVRAARSRFSVTIECCDVVPSAAAPAGAGPPRAAGGPVDPRWPEPAPQPGGRGWIYDLFTPPAIFWNPRDQTLHVAADAETTALAHGAPDIELLRVRPGPFRLQLIGYAGPPDDLRGIFADRESGETVVARGGDRLPAQGVTITRLALERSAVGGDGDTAGREAAAIAVVTEDDAGDGVELSSRRPCLAGAPVGLFASRRTAAQQEAAAGESFVLDGISYCVDEIDLEPPQATVACAPVAGGPTALRIVRPAEAARALATPGLAASTGGGAAAGDTP